MGHDKINTSGNTSVEQNRVSQITEEALASGSLRSLWHTIAWEGRDREFNEYDTRRVLAKEGVDLLENALTSVGDRRTQHEFRYGDRRSLEQVDDVRNFAAASDEDAILGMRHVVQDHIQDARSTWQQIASMSTPDGTPVLHSSERPYRQLKARYHDALEREYTWQMRDEGFQVGLRSMGLQIDAEQGAVVESAATLTPQEALAFVRQLPDENEFRTQYQLPPAPQGNS